LKQEIADLEKLIEEQKEKLPSLPFQTIAVEENINNETPISK
jgi:hypothetical protein